VLSLLCCGLFTKTPAIFVGVRALSEIEIERGRLTGKGLAWAGIFLGIVGTIGSIAVGGYRATHGTDQFSRSAAAGRLPRLAADRSPRAKDVRRGNETHQYAGRRRDGMDRRGAGRDEGTCR
jgi:hypothetical protein